MRRTSKIAALGAVACTLLAPGVAAASTSVTVSITGGTLSISEPGSVTLGPVTPSATGTSVTGHLGVTTITDNRGSIAGWTTSISATSLSDGATPTPHTIAANKMKAYIATGDGPTVSAGVAVPVTTYTTALTGLALSTSTQTLLSATATGSNIVTYNPTLTITLDSTVIAGTYTGTITQTVS